jgi:hypothetical protein
MQQSPAAAVLFANPGMIRLVTLYVKVAAASNIRINLAPAWQVPNELIVPVPDMCKKLPVAVLRSTVAPDAKVDPLFSKIAFSRVDLSF